jgi:hypothetical protein
VRVDKTLNNGSRSGKGICDEGKMYKILNRFSDPGFFFFLSLLLFCGSGA